MVALLRGYDHLYRGRESVAQRVLVDVDALDDAAVLGTVHRLVLRFLGLVQGRGSPQPGKEYGSPVAWENWSPLQGLAKQLILLRDKTEVISPVQRIGNPDSARGMTTGHLVLIGRFSVFALF